LAESAISASVNAASRPPGSQVSGSSAFASEPARPVRSENEPTKALSRCQTDTVFSDLPAQYPLWGQRKTSAQSEPCMM